MDIFDFTLPQGPASVFNDLKELPAFTYEPLKSDQHIRLLKITEKRLNRRNAALSDSSRSLTSSYEIVHVDLKDVPNYQAISYVWGDPAKTHAVKVNRRNRLRITKTLAAALPHLTELCSTGFLWIDQICIDQSNVQERNHQVKIMGQIYKNAQEVLIWTGEDIAGLQEMINKPLSEELSVDEMEIFTQFFSRSWFKRAWTVQEAVLARRANFVAGSCRIPLDSLVDVWCRGYNRWTSEHEDRMADASRTYSAIITLRSGTNFLSLLPESGFHGLLNKLAPAQTSDPRDHVYAFLGLQSNSRITIVPDYNLSTSQVFTAAARAIIEGTETLDVFRYLPRRSNPTNQLQLPSWVPDWSTRNLYPRILKDFVHFHKTDTFDAARGLRHRLLNTHRSGQNELLVRGRIVDFVDSGLPPLYGPIYHSIYPMKEGSKRRSVRIARQKQPPERFFSLSSDQVALIDENAFTDQTQSLRKRLITVLFAGTVEAEKFLEQYDNGFEKDISKLTDLRYSLQHMSIHRVVHTQQGKLALVSGAARGDAIAILHGLDVPVILRQSIGGTYIVVGQCYLEDAMFGETVTWEEHEADSFTLV